MLQWLKGPKTVSTNPRILGFFRSTMFYLEVISHFASDDILFFSFGLAHDIV